MPVAGRIDSQDLLGFFGFTNLWIYLHISPYISVYTYIYTYTYIIVHGFTRMGIHALKPQSYKTRKAQNRNNALEL